MMLVMIMYDDDGIVNDGDYNDNDDNDNDNDDYYGIDDDDDVT